MKDIYFTPVYFTKDVKRRIVAEVFGIVEEDLYKVLDSTGLRLKFTEKVERGIEFLLNSLKVYVKTISSVQ